MKVVEVLVHLELRLNSTLSVVKQLINLAKQLLEYIKVYFELKFTKNKWFLSHVKYHLLCLNLKESCN
jgi:hypothetical protein